MKTWLIAASAFGGIFASDIIRLSAVILKKNMRIDSMPEYVKLEALKEAFRSVTNDCTCPIHLAAEIDQILDQSPAADVAPVRHGRWIPFHSAAAGDIQYCSSCEIGCTWKPNYCPNCGAKMMEG